jgi:hypothetical protein
MEPERSAVDLAVLSFIKLTLFQPGDFLLHKDGLVRLNPQLAKKVADLA